MTAPGRADTGTTAGCCGTRNTMADATIRAGVPCPNGCAATNGHATLIEPVNDPASTAHGELHCPQCAESYGKEQNQ